MTLLEYIEARIKDGNEFDIIVGDVEMPATLGLNEDWKITDYCKQKYGDLLNSEVIEHNDPTGRYTDSVEVLYDDADIGEQFTWAVAGYISEGEWNLLFIEGEAIENG